jgi:hypothetical protein
MKNLSAVALCLMMVGLSVPATAQYGGYDEPRRGGRDGYGEGRRGGGGDYDGGGRARGSFYGSCRGIEQDGPILRAMCRTRDGDYIPSQINLRRCGGTPISNRDGRLSC